MKKGSRSSLRERALAVVMRRARAAGLSVGIVYDNFHRVKKTALLIDGKACQIYRVRVSHAIGRRAFCEVPFQRWRLESVANVVVVLLGDMPEEKWPVFVVPTVEILKLLNGDSRGKAFCVPFENLVCRHGYDSGLPWWEYEAGRVWR